MCECGAASRFKPEVTQPVRDLATRARDNENKTKNFGDVCMTQKGLKRFVMKATETV